jgi:hypothetical protein
VSTGEENDKVIFRFKAGLPRLQAKAKTLGVSPHRLARELVEIGLDEGWADGARTNPGPPPIDEYRELLMRACFAVIVALSPTMDEEETGKWIQDVFGETGGQP